MGKVVGGMVKPAIKKMCAKLPGVLEPAKQPLETTGVKTFEDVVLIVQDPADWNSEGKDKIVKSIIANVKSLAGSLQSIGMDAVKGIIGGEEDKAVALKEGRGELAKHLGHVSAQLTSQLGARELGESLGDAISNGLLEKQHEMLRETTTQKAAATEQSGGRRRKRKK